MAITGNLFACLKFLLVALAFCCALFLGALKGLFVGPIAASILIGGNVGIILGMFPAHVAWTVYALVKTNRLDVPLKAALFLALPGLFALWVGVTIAGSVLVGLGYGFFTPWVSTFEAFRHDQFSKMLYHFIVDGTWGTIRGSCIVVTDFADFCYHSFRAFMKELRNSLLSNEQQTLRLIYVPGFIIAGVVGLLVDIPLFAAIALFKSPYMLFKGWYRLIHDLISREGPFLETACIPIAGLAILLWPLVVVGSVLLAIFSSIFVGLYAAVVVYQERSFRRGLAFAVAVVAEFDEYTNDGLYLREGTFLPKPRFRRKKSSAEPPARESRGKGTATPTEPPNMLPSLAPSRSVREVIQEVKMVQIWGAIMRANETRGRELLDAGAITVTDLDEYLKAKNSAEAAIVNVGLPSYSLLMTLLHSIEAGSEGFVLIDEVEVTHLNRPNSKLFDWFFNPLLVVKEQIRVIRLEEGEERFLQKVILYGNDIQRMEAWDNGSTKPHEALKAAQIQGISRRLTGMVRSVSKFPTYRRKYRQVLRALLVDRAEKECPTAGRSRSSSLRSVASVENV